MTEGNQPYVITQRSERDKEIASAAFADGPNNLPGVVISGRLNAPPVPDSDMGFLMNFSDFEKLCAVPPHTLGVVLEHSTTKVGKVLDIWKSDEDQHLWVSAIINDMSTAGAYALDLVRKGKLTGFSIGNLHDPEYYKKTNKVRKLLVHEISLVETPDDPSARFVAIGERPTATVAVNLENWEALLVDVYRIYGAQGREPPKDLLSYLFENQHLAPLVRTLSLMSK